MTDEQHALQDPFDFSDNAATTRWVQEHQWSSNIDRWRIIFDSNNEELNWGYPDGIKGGKTLRPRELDSIYVQGHRVRFFISLNEMNPICITGEFYDKGRMLCGTTLYDGETVSSVSVDVNLEEESLAVHGRDHTNNKNISNFCNLMKIQISW